MEGGLVLHSGPTLVYDPSEPCSHLQTRLMEKHNKSKINQRVQGKYNIHICLSFGPFLSAALK